jgi:autotransporter-associated beta strand protein
LVTFSGGTVTNGTITNNTATNFAAQSGSVAAILAGSAGLTKSGTGTLSLTAANTYSGTTTVNEGTLQLGDGGSAGSLSASSSIVNNATIVINRSNSVTQGTDFSSAAITGLGSLTQAGTGTLSLTAANTYSGTTTVNGGTLQLGNGGSTGSLSASSAIVNNGTFAINRSNSVTQGTDFSGAAITGTGSFTQAGTGTTTLNAANTYSGTTTVNSGTLVASNESALGASSGAITASGGTLDLGGNGFLRTGLVTISGGTVTNGTITNNTATNFDAQSGSVAAILAGSAGLTKSGTGTLSLSGANTYTGTTTVDEGTLSLGTSGSLTATTSVTVTNGATLLLGSSAPNRINANAALNLGGGQLSMGAAGTGGSRASSQTFASLTLTANSSINFANLTGTSSLYFNDIIGLSSEHTLSIFNYNGASSSTGGVGQFTKLYAATSSTSGFSGNLGNILFYSGGDTSSLLGSASFGGTMGGYTEITDIVPVPEPSVVIAALMLLASLLYTNRGAMRRLIGC